jgi:Glycosyl hydrolases family 16
MGLHPFRDPMVAEDFEGMRLAIDIAEFHTYAVDWRSERVDFLVDGELIRSCSHPPNYPMQMMVAVFDFPDRSTGSDSDAIPELIVDYIPGTSASPSLPSTSRRKTIRAQRLTSMMWGDLITAVRHRSPCSSIAPSAATTSMA